MTEQFNFSANIYGNPPYSQMSSECKFSLDYFILQ